MKINRCHPDITFSVSLPMYGIKKSGSKFFLLNQLMVDEVWSFQRRKTHNEMSLIL